jgi:flagellar hook protein FlgE
MPRNRMDFVMGSFDALSSAISGLEAQSFALQNISGNIANAQTTAFKTTDTSFQDLLNAQFGDIQTSDEVQALSTRNTAQGAVQSSDISTFMAIDGDGYFTVEQPTSTGSGGEPSFVNGNAAYTRRGDFQLDGNGYLVNGAGFYLMGTPLDASDGKAAGQALEPLQFNSATLRKEEGALVSLSVESDGQVDGTFASGNTVALASIPLSSFRGEGFLQQGDGGTVTATSLSGAAQAGAGGTIVGSALEASNTDIAGQFSAMIMAQQAYGANTKVVTTSNEMLQTLTNMTL